ncbi:hypothetical protein OOK58_43120 [Streptomyces sp. NBC_01728]|uniref:hypothetical protein n=1 Tax=unclassified Streptomyces TaxID=2593676 RepID=UPI00224DDA63|nr:MULTISPECIES: hypothetical protein [unclassified Streptomyces]MCX4458705.1 hypothetical protein [Streptomyces sp. NBC_01719]MCX4498062.1 hypothetical protein [Streptomyces sp. NBC_01728]
MTTRSERRLAVEHWLLAATRDRKQARQEWCRDGVALLRCGGVFTAVRVPVELVEAAAGTEDRRQMSQHLNEALWGGPAFIDERSRQVYFLVPPSAHNGWRLPHSDCLSADTYLGVPYPGAEPQGLTYWLVEMDGPSMLCTPDAVKQLVMHGRLRLVTGQSNA